MARTPASFNGGNSGSFPLGINDGDAACGSSELAQRIDETPIVDPVGRRLHYHAPRRAEAPLQQAIIRNGRTGREPLSPMRRDWKSTVVDVMVAIACVRRNMSFGAAEPVLLGTVCSTPAAKAPMLQGACRRGRHGG